MYKYGIVVIGYKNEDGVKRLLKALNRVDYDNKKVVLIISIDKSENDDIRKLAEEFLWDFGDKYVVAYPERQGLRKHVLCCGDYLNTYDLDALAVFEDDIMPSRDFFCFMQRATEKYINNMNIAGISLYTHCVNTNIGEPFIPIRSDGDNYFIQYAQSRGQVWFKKQWNEFRDWYKTQGKLEKDYLIPKNVSAWPDTSWLKYHIKYCILMNKYFVYPYISYSTCFGEVGEHVKTRTDDYQVPLSNLQKKSYCFTEFDEAALKYDAFFENQNLYQYCNVNKDELLVDLYGGHVATKKRYVLTKKRLLYKILGSWGDRLIPHEMNLIYGITGNDIFLYDLNNDGQIIDLSVSKVNREKIALYYEILDYWMELEEKGVRLQEYFLKNKWYHIAIYGKGKIGMHLYHRLKNTKVNVEYFIDKKEGCFEGDIQIISPEELIPPVDVVVVTPVMEYEQISSNLKNRGIGNIISITDILRQSS